MSNRAAAWRAMLLLTGSLGLFGCAGGAGLYERMNAAASPSSDDLQQTQLAHIGSIETADGRFEVAVQRLVLTGMLSPRGQRRLLLFTPGGRLVTSYSLADAEPLWCEGGRIYLFGFGSVAGIPPDSEVVARSVADEVPSGNVLDFSRGLQNAVLRRESRYGSSGGIED